MNSAHEWRTLLEAMRALCDDRASRAALVTLVRTRGSTFRRAGTRMLAYADGAVVCELSGGCPQRDIVLRAQESLADGQARMVAYNADSGLDVLLEMGCGGELEVLIEPLLTPASIDYADALLQCLEQRRPLWLATWFAADGRPRAPRRLLWDGAEILHDDFGDAGLARTLATQVERQPLRRATALRLPTAGAEAEVLVEPVTPAHALVVIGGNTAAKAFAPIADLLGWQLTLVDQDPRRLDPRDLPPGVRTVCVGPDGARAALALDANSSVVVMTHNVEQDIAYLTELRDSPVAYIGALGSRERAERMRDDARFSGNVRLHAPAGLDIGSETPAEIAMAVAAEILAVVNRRGGGPLHARSGTIHD